MTQTVKGSVVEALSNLIVGFSLNWTTNLILLPVFGFTSITPTKAFWYGVLMTIVSFVRQYVMRRWFNRMHIFNANQLVK